jgi:F0F1-type ATP synthase epsilon subunit
MRARASAGSLGLRERLGASLTVFLPSCSDVKRYFVSSGFAFVHTNSVADIVAVEAVPLDRLDPEEVRKEVL